MAQHDCTSSVHVGVLGRAGGKITRLMEMRSENSTCYKINFCFTGSATLLVNGWKYVHQLNGQSICLCSQFAKEKPNRVTLTALSHLFPSNRRENFGAVFPGNDHTVRDAYLEWTSQQFCSVELGHRRRPNKRTFIRCVCFCLSFLFKLKYSSSSIYLIRSM